MIELPERDPCDICETLAGRSDVPVIAESELTYTLLNPLQFETGQCCVVTRRHVATLLELTDEESAEILKAARELAHALLGAFEPKGILTFQNNGVYSGQFVPHFHFHVVPRQPGSDWGIGPPQLRQFTDAGRMHSTPHDSSKDDERRDRARVSPETLQQTAGLIRAHLTA